MNSGQLKKTLHPKIYPKKEIQGASSFEQLLHILIQRLFAFEISRVK